MFNKNLESNKHLNYDIEFKNIMKNAIMIALFIPVLLYLLLFIPFPVDMDDAPWLSFWGSFLGGVFGGIVSIYAVYRSFKYNEEKDSQFNDYNLKKDKNFTKYNEEKDKRFEALTIKPYISCNLEDVLLVKKEKNLNDYDITIDDFSRYSEIDDKIVCKFVLKNIGIGLARPLYIKNIVSKDKYDGGEKGVFRDQFDRVFVISNVLGKDESCKVAFAIPVSLYNSNAKSLVSFQLEYGDIIDGIDAIKEKKYPSQSLVYYIEINNNIVVNMKEVFNT